jgi:hypothetical protein
VKKHFFDPNWDTIERIGTFITHAPRAYLHRSFVRLEIRVCVCVRPVVFIWCARKKDIWLLLPGRSRRETRSMGKSVLHTRISAGRAHVNNALTSLHLAV